MSIAIGIKEQDELDLPATLSEADRKRYTELLKLRPHESRLNPLPLDEAIDLYQLDVCGLGRAAELAGVTRWDVLDRMGERGLWQRSPDLETVEEIDAMIEQMRREGYL